MKIQSNISLNLSSILFLILLQGCSGSKDAPASSRKEVETSPKPPNPVERVEEPKIADAAAKAEVRPSKQVASIGGQAFREAAHGGQIALVRKALESGTPVDERDPEQQLTALHMAAYNGHTPIVKLLLDNKAEIDARDQSGMTPLIHACSGPFPETVALLLDSGADANARESSEGFTPLMYAAALGQTDAVKILLAHGADASLRDVDGDQAIDHAQTNRHAEIVAILKQAG